MHQEDVDILIIGGGIAGLATAAHLAQAGAAGLALAEREPRPGFYASGHNAGIARRLTGRAEHTALAAEGRERLAGAGLLRVTGGCLVGAEPGATAALAAEAEAFGLVHEQGAGAPLPGLRAAEWLRLPGDGVIDIEGELRQCAERARAGGARLWFGCGVAGVEPDRDGFRVATGRGALRTRILVNAAGAWAGHLGRMAGGLDLAFQPVRRHLAWSPAPSRADQPWAWWLDRPFYLRPESGGTLLCPCDEVPVRPPPPGVQPEADPGVLDGLTRSVQELAPDLDGVRPARLWCGLRTFAPDRRFVLGFDPVNPNLFWVAGLGGHGMTSGLAVGRLAAEALLGKRSTGALDPNRFWPH
jgi:glycine/D-amino acid oxidase-like deaminating enzyme